MYKYYQAVDDPLVYWRHNTTNDLINVYISDWGTGWEYHALINIEGLRLAIARGETKELENDPLTKEYDCPDDN